MDQVVFTISMARSGAHLLRGLISEAFQVTDIGEIFTPSAVVNKQFRDTQSFDLFLKSRPDLTETVPFGFGSQVDKALNSFFEHQEHNFKSQKLLADVKYGHLNCLTPALQDFSEPPYLWQWMLRSNVPIIHLVRKNLLQRYASNLKSWKTDDWVDYQTDRGFDGEKIEIDTSYLVEKLTEAYRKIQYIDGFLKTRPNSYLIYYEDLLDHDRLSKPTADLLAGFLGPYTELPKPITRKMSPLLSEYVSNYGQVAATLTGTPFEGMLE